MGDFLTYPMRNDGIRVIPPVSDDNLVDSLIQWEGFLPHPKDIGDGKITLGSGLTDPRWHRLYRERGNVWSKEDNRNAVAVEVAKRRKILEGLVPHWEEIEPDTQKAFISYYYNYPFSRENSPKMFEAFDRRDFREAVNQMNATSKNPAFKKGLEIRREKERRWGHAGLNNTGNDTSEQSTIKSIFDQTANTVRSAIHQIVPHGASGRWSEGGSLGNPWDGLSLQEKAEMMKVAVRNGITDLKTIREKYNEFAEGGDTSNQTVRWNTTGGAGYVPPASEWNAPQSIQETRLRFYNQISPKWGFTDDTINAAINTLLFNKNAWSDHPEEIIVDDPYVDTVWAEYLQIPQNKRRHKYTLTQSQYKPTMGDNNNATYYTVPIDEPVRAALVKDAELLPIGKNRLSTTLAEYNHGEHTVGKGVDPQRGQYVSYYDRWDLNPVSSRYSDAKLSRNPAIKMTGLLDNKNYGDLSFGIGKPLDFYDRIYLDDYYGIESTVEPGVYYGGWLPELKVLSNGAGFSTNSMGNHTEYGVPLGTNNHAKGGSIHIKPENRGKFTRLKERTGHSATWFKEHGTPAQKKMATFDLNSRHWHNHAYGGYIENQIYDLPEDEVNWLIDSGYEIEYL